LANGQHIFHLHISVAKFWTASQDILFIIWVNGKATPYSIGRKFCHYFLWDKGVKLRIQKLDKENVWS